MNSTVSASDSCTIETELKDILTIESCTTLVAELIKFILYRKQQLPYTFDRLKYLITKKNSKEMQENASSVPSSVERQFKIAENGLETLELLFEKTREELADSKKGCISEVALLFGSTPMTPKQVYIIHLPKLCLDHSAKNHPERKHLVHLLQSVILSNNLSAMLTKPMSPTNMYLFIKKHRNCELGNESDLNQWFIPKNSYQIPRSGQHFHIKFNHPNSHTQNCTCRGFSIYSEATGASLIPKILEHKPEIDVELEEEDNCWYQADRIFKGFTDVYINGVSVADLWLR
ncbi:hypothetical protein RUM43_007860 [Polyplax serrata]|uniref:MAD2L1-binding protein n=1 Tax=Polyplax serrata TaxID=468196 RepID=A0AAN8S844_POLSC